MNFKRCTADYGFLSLKAMSCSEDDNGDLLESCETSDAEMAYIIVHYRLGIWTLSRRIDYLCGRIAISLVDQKTMVK